MALPENIENLARLFEAGIRSYARRRLATPEQVEQMTRLVLAGLFAAIQNNAVPDRARLPEFVAALMQKVAREQFKQDTAGPFVAQERVNRIAKEHKDQLRGILARMKPLEVDILRLYFIEGRKRRDVCWELGISEHEFQAAVAQAKAGRKGNGA